MLKNKMMFLVPGMLLGLNVLAEKSPDAAALVPAKDQTVLRVDVARQELLAKCKAKVEEANRCMAAGDYDDAVKLLREAWDMVDGRNGEKFNYIAKSCEKKIIRCYLLKAAAAMKKADASAASSDFEAAIKYCQDALDYCPEKKEELTRKIKFYEKRRNAAVLREDSSMAKLDPGKDLQDYQIEVLMEQGRVLVKRNDLVKAKRCFEEVLLLDPYNDAALQDLLGVNDLIRKDSKVRADNTARHMIGQVEWAATIPIVADAPADVADNQLTSPVEKVITNDLEERLKTIVIPSLEWEEPTFKEAMDILVSACRQNDPLKKGVNFILKDVPKGNSSSVQQQQQQQLQENNPLEGENAAEPDENAGRAKLENLSLKRSSVYNALRVLRNRGDLTFKIARNAVYIAAAGVPLEEMVVKTFPSDAGDSKDAQTLQEEITASSGVHFTNGAYIKPQQNHVVVRHTPENLKKIEAALQEINSESDDMVQLMFKFIEVSQKDLDEMAFSWQYARYGDTRTTFTAGNGNMLRHYYSEDSQFDGDAAAANWNGQNGDPDANYNFSWQDGKNKLNFSVYALDWADSSDVLYTPRVTTLSGQTAVIDMSETHYYPSDWETIDSESNDNYTVFVDGAQPTLDDEKALGVKFTITPEVADREIHVPLNIPIEQFYDWLIVDTRSDPTGENSDDDDGEYIKKPIFNKRTIRSDVTIKDGETVLIGSVSNDVTKAILDKVPILGDIPFIGRFFQSRYTNSEKANLLVFMTCRIIKPDGSAKYPDDFVNEGSPTFPRNQ